MVAKDASDIISSNLGGTSRGRSSGRLVCVFLHDAIQEFNEIGQAVEVLDVQRPLNAFSVGKIYHADVRLRCFTHVALVDEEQGASDKMPILLCLECSPQTPQPCQDFPHDFQPNAIAVDKEVLELTLHLVFAEALRLLLPDRHRSVGGALVHLQPTDSAKGGWVQTGEMRMGWAPHRVVLG